MSRQCSVRQPVSSMNLRRRPMTYQEAEAKLAGRDRVRLEGKVTWLERICRRSIGLRYHDTIVVRWWEDGSVQLNDGGWRTTTTLRKMRTYSPYPVYQSHLAWFVAAPNGLERYRRGMIIPSPH